MGQKRDSRRTPVGSPPECVPHGGPYVLCGLLPQGLRRMVPEVQEVDQGIDLLETPPVVLPQLPHLVPAPLELQEEGVVLQTVTHLLQEA